MTIKHLVIAGGGPLGLQYLGALEKLEEQSFWKRENIESIYGTSIGSFVGAFICLNYDWETLNKYIIERPWHDAFKPKPKQILDAYYNKGIYDIKLIEVVFKALLEAKDLSLNITLKEFYEFSKIDFHIFTFDVNHFKVVELTHLTHPDLRLLQAITMSSALPGIFIPTILDGMCLVDGGIMCNYPINQCLRDHPEEDDILGIKSVFDNKILNVTITEDTSFLEYVIGITINTMISLRESIQLHDNKNTVICGTNVEQITLDSFQKTIHSQELRKQWFDSGQEEGAAFLAKLQ